MDNKVKNLIVRTISGAVYVALMTLSVFFSWVAIPLSLFLIFVGFYEYFSLSKKKYPQIKKNFVFWLASAISVVAVFLCKRFDFYFNTFAAILIPVALLCVFLPELINKNAEPQSNVGLGLMMHLWLIVPICLIFCCWIPISPAQVLAFFILVWASDTFAYLGGSLFGKHKIAERISPGKTWEGFAISCCLTVALAVAMSYFSFFNSDSAMGGQTSLKLVILALSTEIFGIIGDLVESLMKRTAGVKDSGNIIPGHGGVLDRIDSILFATIPNFLFLNFLFS